MDELCLSIRTLRQFRSPSNAEKPEEWAKDIGDILETAEESVINELTDILAKKIQKGLPMEGAREVRRRWVNEIINGDTQFLDQAIDDRDAYLPVALSEPPHSTDCRSNINCPLTMPAS